LLLQGCAFAEVKVKLDPSPTIASTEGLQREVVVFPTVDRRPNAKSCGARRNANGADVGRVRCLMEPTQWLNETILNGLDRRSFKVVTLQSAKSKAPLQVSLTLKTLFVDEVLETERASMLADVEVHLVVRTASGLLAERSFFVREREIAPTDGSYQDTLTLASRQMSNAILDAIVELANRYPALGKVEQATAARSPR
jgi:hypothetical protein